MNPKLNFVTTVTNADEAKLFYHHRNEGVLSETYPKKSLNGQPARWAFLQNQHNLTPGDWVLESVGYPETEYFNLQGTGRLKL